MAFTAELIAVHQSLSRLERLDPSQGRMVELAILVASG
jgi:hypothetical protein